MKTSHWILIGLAGTALVVLTAKLLRNTSTDSDDEDLHFDADFIPGAKKFSKVVPDPNHPSWFKPQSHSIEDSEALFI